MSDTENQGLVSVDNLDDCQRGPVDRDRTLVDEVLGQLRRQGDAHDLPVLARCAIEDRSGAVDVTLHDVAAEAGAGLCRALEIDLVADRQVAERCLVERLLHDVCS